MTTRTASQERNAQILAVICSLVITTLVVVVVIAARGAS